MAKFYVQCSHKQMVLLALDARAAAVKAFCCWIDEELHALLGAGILVSQRGFGRSEAARISTFELLAEIEGVSPEQVLANALAEADTMNDLDDFSELDSYCWKTSRGSSLRKECDRQGR